MNYHLKGHMKLISHLSPSHPNLPLTPGVYRASAMGGQSKHVLYEMDAITPFYSELSGSLEGVRNLCIEAQPGSVE